MPTYMLSRYDYDGLETTSSRKMENGKERTRKRLRTSLMPEIPERDGDIYIVTRDGDRLDLLADEYYGSPYLWWYIAHANGLGKGTWIVEPGLTIRIPVTAEFSDQIEEVQEYNRTR